MNCNSPLLTDLYQLTMLQVYWKQGMNEEAVFEFFTRSLPKNRGFLVAAGLEQVLDYLEGLQFSAEELDWLQKMGRFHDGFIGWLGELEFTGEVMAVPEGTVCFANEPILRVTAPLPEAQLIESRLINLMQFQTLVASKAARVVLAAPDKFLVDFSLRRAHGAEAGLLAARASYIAGMSGTSNVLADEMFGIPSFGTVAHSMIQAHDDEAESFLNFAHVHRGPIVFLIDTYDTEAAAQKVVELAPQLKDEGIQIHSVRLDSGDLIAHSKKVRAILDRGGLKEVGIFVSGGLDEADLQRFRTTQAPIDGFGIGTKLGTSADAPYLDCAYKLVEYAGKPRLKRSEGKAIWPGRKQVWRTIEDGTFVGDVVTLEDDTSVGAQQAAPLQKRVMAKGQRLEPTESLDQIRQRAAAQLAALPEPLRQLKTEPPYSVTISDSLRELARNI